MEAASVTLVAAPVVPDSATEFDAAPELALLRDWPMAVDAPVFPLGAAVAVAAGVTGSAAALAAVGSAGMVEGTELGVELWATAAPPRKNSMAATTALTDALTRETARTETQPAFICQSFWIGPWGPWRWFRSCAGYVGRRVAPERPRLLRR
jgi:hypothetical protein